MTGGTTSATPLPVPAEELALVAAGRHRDPHAVLGAHPTGPDGDITVTVRALKPLADSVVVRYRAGDVWAEASLTHEHEGIWAGVVPVAEVPDYRLLVTYGGTTLELDDPYRFWPTLSDLDLHLITEGRHEELWRALGARVQHYPGLGEARGVSGTAFTVWAPGAHGVRLEGDFNSWDGREHPMRQLGGSGVWELFVPGVGSGARYKYRLLDRAGGWHEHADPMAGWAEVPPATSSMVFESGYGWGDDAWLTGRAERQPVGAPMSVYELHLGSWRRGRSYRDLADELVDYLIDLGFTHVELMPVMQHPYGGSWGYHVTGYYAPDSRYGTPDDLRYLIDRLHQAGIGVILDWVPGHFATDEWALARLDGAALYEHPDPRRGWHQDWGSFIFDFGRPQVRNFLYANALYWLEEFHVDGLRVDGVASMLYLDYSRAAGEWVPNVYGGREHLEAVELLQWTNAAAYRRNPGIVMIAEESTAWPGVTQPTDHGGLGFGFKWNMGWMHDTLDYLHRDPIHRRHHHGELTHLLDYAWSENYLLPLSHDEVVHGKGSLVRKMPGDRWQRFATLRAYLAFMWAFPGKQLLFMGGEFGQESEWAEARELDWWLLDDPERPEHQGVRALVRELNGRYRGTSALWSRDNEPGGFGWLVADDADRNVLAFARYARAEADHDASALVCVANFSPNVHRDYALPLPADGAWTVALNTDEAHYAGGGVSPVHIEAAEGCAVLTLPPLGVLWLTPG